MCAALTSSTPWRVVSWGNLVGFEETIKAAGKTTVITTEELLTFTKG